MRQGFRMEVRSRNDKSRRNKQGLVNVHTHVYFVNWKYMVQYIIQWFFKMHIHENSFVLNNSKSKLVWFLIL